MMRTIAFIFFLSIIVLSYSAAHAATDTFTVRTLVGGDTTPPNAPSGLTATPVSISQIDLNWNVPWDDFGVAAYQVFRDSTQIATTTNTTYSDIGLTASTTYAYFIRAVDDFNNISTSSAEVSTTTLQVPVSTSTPSGAQSGSRARLPELVMLTITPSQTGAVVRYETERYVRSVVRWGKTLSYELGSSAERSFAKVHEIRISDLEPGTSYKISIEGENYAGVTGILTETSFTTLPLEDVLPPGNVMNLVAYREENDAVLTWKNPEDSDFEYVRIVRNSSFYPSDEIDGWVVYEGSGEEVRDTAVFAAMQRAYYTVFTYDSKGNISSGAVIAIGEGAPDVPIDPALNPLELRFRDIEFYQGGTKLEFMNELMVVNGGQHLTIALPYEKVPEHLKAILITLTPASDPEKTLQFLLRINADKTSYTARIAPLGVNGAFTLRMTVFDFDTAQIGYAEGTIKALIRTYEEDREQMAIPGFITKLLNVGSSTYLLMFTVLLVLLTFISYRLLRARW